MGHMIKVTKGKIVKRTNKQTQTKKKMCKQPLKGFKIILFLNLKPKT